VFAVVLGVTSAAGHQEEAHADEKQDDAQELEVHRPPRPRVGERQSCHCSMQPATTAQAMMAMGMIAK
jgi:hypothetical protein